MCCIPGLSPCSSGRSAGTFALSAGATKKEAQGIEDLFKDVCAKVVDKIGCSQRQARGENTLWASVHRESLKSIKVSFPEADSDCIARAVASIINGLAEATQQCATNQTNAIAIVLRKVAPAVGELLQCLFGAERGVQLEIATYRQVNAQVAEWVLCLATTLLPMLLKQCMGGGDLLSGACPPTGSGGGSGNHPTDPIFGIDAPPFESVVDRGGIDNLANSTGTM